MEKNEIAKTTIDFYSCFCGTDISVSRPGIHFICTENRDYDLRGYGCKYSIYILLRDSDCTIAYSPKYQTFFEKCSDDIEGQELISSISQQFQLKARQLMIFEEELVSDYKCAKILTPADYPLYEKFFKKAHPSINEIDWLKEYFDEKVEKGLFTGYIVDGELVSVCDAPDMPYMEEYIQHTGIMTLPKYRRKGYGKCCTALAAHHYIGMNIVPQWDCALDNRISVELAKAIGYVEFAQAYFFEE